MLTKITDVVENIKIHPITKYVDKLFTLISVAIIEPFTVNVDKIVALVAIKLYALTSYNPELFILQFILLYISLELKK